MDRVMPGSIPDAPTFGKAKSNDLPGITCPDPSQYLDFSTSKGDIPKSRKRKAKSSSSSRSNSRDRSRVNVDRDRADRLQLALLAARRRAIGQEQVSPFDLNRNGPGAPDASAFLTEADNARLR